MFHITPQTERIASNIANFVVDEDHEYTTPTKCVKTPQDMQLWEKSEAYFEYMGFLLAMNEAVIGKSLSVAGANQSSRVTKVIDLLEAINLLIDETPPVHQPQRFGNAAFRSFYQKLKDQLFDLLKKVLPPNLYRAIPEIMIYLNEGFGNSTRIDYGTGHEISFLMFLCCLFKIGVLIEEDKGAVVSKIFSKYLDIVRRLQQVYRMEPAGSHGVWSLDDYQFVPFIWGSAQLIAHPRIEPSSFLHQEIIANYAHDFMFLGCIKYINSVKVGPFAEHSNQLWGISGVSNWSKINGGLIKMYKVEVLGKFPVVQHIVFGSLLSIKPAEPNSSLRKTRMQVTPPSSIYESATSVTKQTSSVSVMRSVSEHVKPASGSNEVPVPSRVESDSKLENGSETDALNQTEAPNQAEALNQVDALNQADTLNQPDTQNQADTLNQPDTQNQTDTLNPADALNTADPLNQADTQNQADTLNPADALNTADPLNQADEQNRKASQ